MITWSEYVTKILRNTLRDEGLTTWTEPQVYDNLGWALDHFAAHTALVKEAVYEDGSSGPYGIIDMSTSKQFIVPDDNYESLDLSAHIFSIASDGKITNYDPLNETKGLSINSVSEPSFLVWPDGILNLDSAPGDGSKLVIRYFGYYDHPTPEDGDQSISIPRWAQKPVATLVAAYCLEGLGVESANIDRWKDDTDSGNPEHNALRKQQQFLMSQYEYMISQHTPQDRTNFFREYARQIGADNYYTTWSVSWQSQ